MYSGDRRAGESKGFRTRSFPVSFDVRNVTSPSGISLAARNDAAAPDKRAARSDGLLGRRHHINVVEVNIFKAPAKIFLVPKENLIEVSHAANKHTKMDVELVKSSR